MSIRKIISTDIYKARGERTGTIVSPIRELWDDALGMVFCADVDIGQDKPLKNVPICVSNRDIFYSDMGKAVTLKRINNNKWVIVGLAKTSISTGTFIYMSFSDDLVEIVSTAKAGYTIRPLTFGELGDLAPNGFGELPWGCQGKFDLNGNLIEILGG